jgi:CDP-glucose 4,6-dehydratase
MVARSWAQSFFSARGIAVATARAGNAIGGGDWSEDRLIPDIWRALRGGSLPELRYPDSTRPWQHVLEPLSGYLLYAERLAQGGAELPEALNFAPLGAETVTVAEVATAIAGALGVQGGWKLAAGQHAPEMQYLALDATLAYRALGWKPRLTAAEALEWTASWYRAFDGGEDARALSVRQIELYEKLVE